MIIIEIYDNNNEIRIRGHGSNEACARVSTLIQFAMIELRDFTTSDSFTSTGNSYLCVRNLDDRALQTWVNLVTCFIQLESMYKRNIRIESRCA